MPASTRRASAGDPQFSPPFVHWFNEAFAQLTAAERRELRKSTGVTVDELRAYRRGALRGSPHLHTHLYHLLWCRWHVGSHADWFSRESLEASQMLVHASYVLTELCYRGGRDLAFQTWFMGAGGWEVQRALRREADRMEEACGCARCRGHIGNRAEERDRSSTETARRMATQADEFYATLGVAPTASDAEVTRAYRRLARRHHPDLNPSAAAVATEQFKLLGQAYGAIRKIRAQGADGRRSTRRAARQREACV